MTEPVAWQLRHPNVNDGEWYLVDQDRYQRATAIFERRCLYTSPPKREPEPVIDKSAAIRIATSLGWTPQRKPLTDEEIADLWSAQIFHIVDLKLAKDFVRDVEAALGIKGEA